MRGALWRGFSESRWWRAGGSCGVVAAPAMDQLVADGPGASLQTSNTISPLLLLLAPLASSSRETSLSASSICLLPLVVRCTSAPPMNAMAGVTCVSAADVSPHCLPPQQPCPPHCNPASVEGLHSQWTRGGSAHPGNGPKTSSPAGFGPLGPSGEAFLARVCLSSRSRAQGNRLGWSLKSAGQAYGRGTHGAPGGGHLGHHHPTIGKIILRSNCSNTI